MLTIAWDIDDVLNDLMREWHKSLGFSLPYDDISKNPPHEILQISRQAYLESLDHFRATSYSKLLPLKEVRDWFLTNGHKCRHIALSSVPLNSAHISAEWVIRNFGDWIRTFHFVPSIRKEKNVPVYDKNKGEFLSWIKNVDIFIDDTEENIRSAESSGVKSMIFPRPWNSQKSQSIKSFLEVLHNEII